MRIKKINLMLIIMLAGFTLSVAEEKIYRVNGRGPAGGIIFYDKGDNSNGWRYLEAAPADQPESKWGCSKKSIRAAKNSSVGAGKQNTLYIKQNCAEFGTAQKICSELSIGGFHDWFLPSKDELNLMYENLKLNGIGDFAGGFYWSSTDGRTGTAWGQFFYNGQQASSDKNGAERVRAIRAF